MSEEMYNQLSNATVLVDQLWQNNSRTHREETLRLLEKIFSNIKEHPDEQRYRRINIFKINTTHSIVPEFTPLLLASGFIPCTDGIHLQLNDKQMDLCTAVYSIIKDRINWEENQLAMERQKVIEKSKKKQNEYMNARIRKKEAIKKKIEMDRKDTKQEFKASGVSSKQRDIKYWKSHNIYRPSTVPEDTTTAP
eukprot:CAMPEP_0197027518 /NCGR_PEP_ID=MMETSP1384-20130603/7414_1 /TAXON_ID=29189 /ORGANISM="Ammonia sp." /LENGTH=193 /DNA_ID=CAMNT_0042456379 /DNA_START=44 /DNA_END=625 /DNA_ORIENTATION=+